MKTEVVRASEMQGLVTRIRDIRHPEIGPNIKKSLAKYNRARGKKPEVDRRLPTSLLGSRAAVGFVEIVHGQEVFFEKPPEDRGGRAYSYLRYMAGECGWKAQSSGLLAQSQFNRDIRPDRVDAYAEVMKRGEWRDLLSDPITLTDEGQVINGQHRIAAACGVDWSTVPNDPQFLVVWGVSGEEAMFADGSRRTDRDHRIILEKVLSDKEA